MALAEWGQNKSLRHDDAGDWFGSALAEQLSREAAGVRPTIAPHCASEPPTVAIQ